MEAEQRKTLTDIRRVKFEQTSITATATINAERKARLEKTERLRAAREAQEAHAIADKTG